MTDMIAKTLFFLEICCVITFSFSTPNDSDETQIQINDNMSSGQTEIPTLKDVRQEPSKEETTRSGEQILHSTKTSAHSSAFSDPAWKDQWYSQDYRVDGEGPVMDHDVVPVYRMGITGYDVTVGILADGVVNQPDFEGHYDAQLAFKGVLLSFVKHAVASSLDPVDLQASGTMAASVMVMRPNNTLCGVGVAYGAKVTSIKMEKKMTAIEWEDVLEHKLDKIDIYAIVVPRGDLGLDANVDQVTKVLDALTKGANYGHNLHGAIYLYPAGDDGGSGENCATDLLANARMTVVVAAANQRGGRAAYSERCAAVFATAYSGDQSADGGIVAQDSRGRCVTSYSGTGASVAIAAGIIALVLEANPNLQSRDVMHLITMTSEVAPLANNPNTWKKNGAGFWVSSDFGFGLLNAHNMVRMALRWTEVDRVILCNLKFNTLSADHLEPGSSQNFEMSTTGSACERPGGKRMRMNQVEQVKLMTDIRYDFRGSIRITLRSPSRTEVTMMDWRNGDVSGKGFKKWGLRAVQFWGENPKGVWTVNVAVSETRRNGMSAFLTNFSRGATRFLSLGILSKKYNVIRSLELRIYGTESLTYLHSMMIPRRYAKFETPKM